MSNKIIAIIDDDPDILNLLKRILAVTNMSIVTYKSGADFLDNLLRIKTRIALLILDLNMPGTNGLVVLKKIQEMRKYNKFKVCILSALNNQSVVEKATELGADGFLTKPVDKLTLITKISELLRLQETPVDDISFAKVNFHAMILNSPVLLNFYIVGITHEKVLIDSIFYIREEYDMTFNSKELSEALGCEKEFIVKVTKVVPIKQKFMISADFLNMTPEETQTLKSYILRSTREQISISEGMGT